MFSKSKSMPHETEDEMSHLCGCEVYQTCAKCRPTGEIERWRATWRYIGTDFYGKHYRCLRCGHPDDYRREAHYSGCAYVREKLLKRDTEHTS